MKSTGFLFIYLLTGIYYASAQKLHINEIMAINHTVICDESGKFEDWIEIFNPGETAVDMGGMYITDDSTRPTKFRIPQGEPGPIVPAGGFLLLWADDDWEEGVTHLEIKLSGDGEFLALYDNDGKSLIDSLKFGPQQPDVSYGRLSDGGAVWRFFNLPSPGSSNHKTGAQ